MIIRGELKSGVKLWGEKDSNLRSLATTELQSVPFGHSGIPPLFHIDISKSIRNGRNDTNNKVNKHVY
jgi:hypothetical protein